MGRADEAGTTTGWWWLKQSAGIKSNIRRLMFPGQNVEAIPISERVFITAVPTSVLQADGRLARFLNTKTFNVVLGPGKFCVSRAQKTGKYDMRLVVTDYGAPGAVDGSWNIPADLDELRGLFAGFNEPVRAYLEHMESAEMWQMAYGRRLEAWSTASGRVVLAGDAAHAMLPHRAMGLSQGIEDAAALARLVRWAPALGFATVVRLLRDGTAAAGRPHSERIRGRGRLQFHADGPPSKLATRRCARRTAWRRPSTGMPSSRTRTRRCGRRSSRSGAPTTTSLPRWVACFFFLGIPLSADGGADALCVVAWEPGTRLSGSWRR